MLKCNYKDHCKSCSNCSWYEICKFSDRYARDGPNGKAFLVVTLPHNAKFRAWMKRDERALSKGGVSNSGPPRIAVRVTNKLDTK